MIVLSKNSSVAIPKPKVGILSLGCPRNLVDSESILSGLSRKGYRVVDMEDAAIGIVNTCAFIDDAKRESIDSILDMLALKKKGRLKKVIVYGCLSQRYKEELARRLPEVDAFIGRISPEPGADCVLLTPAHYRYLKICEGCINNCSFCVIPRIKGKFTSVGMESLAARVRQLDSLGVRELNIVGQDITGYGLDLYGEYRLCALLKKIIRHNKNIGWFRLLYLYPSRITEELVDLIKDEGRLCKYIDMPIQHINERILKLMGRLTSKKEIIKTIEMIRKKIPRVTLRTSVIAGFPSETESEFKELVDFIREYKFERLGAFVYSAEETTPAQALPGQLPHRIKSQRFDGIMKVQQDVSSEINRRYLGCTLEVIIDEEERDGYLGRTQSDAPEVDGLVYVSSERKLKAGEFVKVAINDTLEYDLVGRVAE